MPPSPKKYVIPYRLRLTREEAALLSLLSQRYQMSRSDVLRRLLHGHTKVTRAWPTPLIKP